MSLKHFQVSCDGYLLPLFQSLPLKKERTEPPWEQFNSLHRREDVLALRLKIPLNQCCTSQVWRSFHLIAFSKWDEDKLLDLDAGTGSSGIQTPATVSDLCMSQHLSESSLLFSCSSPLQVVFHSRYKQQYETKFREERDFWCRAREDGSLCDYRHPKTGD